MGFVQMQWHKTKDVTDPELRRFCFIERDGPSLKIMQGRTYTKNYF
jgi:hypothetical protein